MPHYYYRVFLQSPVVAGLIPMSVTQRKPKRKSRHPGLDPGSRNKRAKGQKDWIPAFAGMTVRAYLRIVGLSHQHWGLIPALVRF
jgi:hypothetical protein